MRKMNKLGASQLKTKALALNNYQNLQQLKRNIVTPVVVVDFCLAFFFYYRECNVI